MIAGSVPRTSFAVQPNMRSAAGFQSSTVRSVPNATIASAALSTTARAVASTRSRPATARCCVTASSCHCLAGQSRQGTRSQGAGSARRPGRGYWARHACPAALAQVAICMVLLVCSGLFLRSLNSAGNIDTGFAHRNLLLMAFDPSLNRYSPAETRRLLDRISEHCCRHERQLSDFEHVFGLDRSRRVDDNLVELHRNMA